MESCAVGLIAFGIGYLVLVQAGKEAGGMRILGKIVGIVIMVVSLLGGICAVKCKMGVCGGKAPMCPFTAKAAPEAPVQS